MDIIAMSTRSKMNQKEKHSILLSEFIQGLSKKQDIKIVCQGDSLTEGYDILSEGTINATKTDDTGATHTQLIVPTPWPEQLQANLRLVYHNNITVINKGWSGDWVERSYQRWTNNESADLAIIMLGTNDAQQQAAGVPDDVEQNINKYLTDMRKLIRRYISWGTPVILMTPIRKKDQEVPTATQFSIMEAFRTALVTLGQEMNVPVIDTEEFFNGCDYTYYSDSVHLNQQGYTFLSARITSFLIGYGPFNHVQLRSGSNLGVRSTRDHVVAYGATTGYGATSGGGEEGTNAEGLYAQLDAGEELWYGFETLEDNLILIPIQVIINGAVGQYTLDFNTEQGSIPLLFGANQGTPQGTKPLSQISYSGNTTGAVSYDGTINLTTTDRYIHITNKGWHNLKITNTGAGQLFVNGFVVMSYKDFDMQYKTRLL